MNETESRKISKKKKSWFIEKIKRIDKSLARLTKKKQRRHNTNIRSETGTFTTDHANIERIIREYYEQLYIHIFDNMDEIKPTP